jgi:hypothetical protein
MRDAPRSATGQEHAEPALAVAPTLHVAEAGLAQQSLEVRGRPFVGIPEMLAGASSSDFAKSSVGISA